MKEKIIYVCEICHSEYRDKELAEKCEKSHICAVNEQSFVYMKYHKHVDNNENFMPNYPAYIGLRFCNDEIVKYSYSAIDR